MLEVKNFSVNHQKTEIVHQINLFIKPCEIVVLLGQNGSGKSTLANALMGHPSYEVTSGQIFIDGQNITGLKTDEKVKSGLFLAWQNPLALGGISLPKLLRELLPREDNLKARLDKLREDAKKFCFSESLLIRGLNDGFSGGEKKKMEMLQAKLLGRKYLIFDEIDTGLDVDAIKVIAEEINQMKREGRGCLVITHYPRLIKSLDLDRVLVMSDGQIVKTGDRELASEIEKKGYKMVLAEN